MNVSHRLSLYFKITIDSYRNVIYDGRLGCLLLDFGFANYCCSCFHPGFVLLYGLDELSWWRESVAGLRDSGQRYR